LFVTLFAGCGDGSNIGKNDNNVNQNDNDNQNSNSDDAGVSCTSTCVPPVDEERCATSLEAIEHCAEVEPGCTRWVTAEECTAPERCDEPTVTCIGFTGDSCSDAIPFGEPPSTVAGIDFLTDFSNQVDGLRIPVNLESRSGRSWRSIPAEAGDSEPCDAGHSLMPPPAV
jgi:hypothetical protein